MATLDLSTYQGRQAARDAGYWVGTNNSGQIVAEADHPGGQANASSGGGGGGGGSSTSTSYSYSGVGAGSLSAVDGQTLSGQSPDTQTAFKAAYGANAEQAWVQERNSALGTRPPAANGGASTGLQPAAPPPATQQAPALDLSPLWNAINQSNQNNFALQKQAAQDAHDRAVQDLQLARNADQRAQALLDISKAQQTLSELNAAETKRQFDVNLQQRQAEFNQSQYTDTAKSLLAGAANLRGPADWAQYTRNVTGGRNLNESLFGATPSPKFGAPAGYTPPVSISGVLGDLGYLPGGTANGTPQQPTTQQVPLPHQWDPATWDSMPDTAKQLILGMAQAGNTSSGAWDPGDYLGLPQFGGHSG